MTAATRKHRYQADDHGTVPNALAREQFAEGVANQQVAGVVDKINARRMPGRAVLDYSAFEEPLERLCQLVEQCDGQPAALGRMAREDRGVLMMMRSLRSGVAVTGHSVVEFCNDALFHSYLCHREELLAIKARREAMKRIAEQGAELVLRDHFARGALGLGALARVEASDTPEAQVTERRLESLLGDDDEQGIREGDVRRQSGEGP